MTKYAVVALMPMIFYAQVARADDAANVDRAQTLFDQARGYFENENYTAACPEFEESKKIANGLGVTLYLAACEDAIGKRATALALYREAELMARARGDSREQVAHQAVLDLDNKAARIRMHLSKASPQAVVTDNGRVVGIDSRGFAADPGWHKLAVTDGTKKWQQSVRVPETSDDAAPPVLDVFVQVQDDAQKTAAPPLATAPPELDARRSNGSTQKAIGIGLVAAGAVSMGLGTYFGAHAISLRNESNDPGGGCNASDQCDGHGQSLRSSALDSATISTVLFAVGGAAVVGGVVLYVVTPSTKSDMTVALGPTGATLRGSF